MYTIQKITVKDGREWKDVPATEFNIPTSTLAEYNDGFVDLEHTSFDYAFQCLLRDLPGIKDVNQPFDDYIQTVDVNTVSQVLIPRTLNRTSSLRYVNLFAHGFSGEASQSVNGPSAPVNPLFLPDIKIVKAKPNAPVPITMENHYLYSVNGDVYIPEYNNGEVFLIDAGINQVLRNESKISVLDFSGIGGFLKNTLDDTTVRLVQKTNLESIVEVDIDIPNYLKKTPFIVINGSFQIFSKNLSVALTSRLRIKIDHRLALRHAAFKDPSSITFCERTENGIFDLTTFDAVELMLGKNSGVFFINHDNLAVHEEWLHRSAIPFHYTHHRPIRGLCFHDNNLLAEYRINKVKPNVVSIVTSPPRISRSVMDSVDATDMTVELPAPELNDYTQAMVRSLDIYVLHPV